MDFRKGKIYHVTFLDHVQDGDKPLTFEVFGRLARNTKTSITLLTWGYPKKLTRDENTNYFTIVKSAIKSAVELSPAD